MNMEKINMGMGRWGLIQTNVPLPVPSLPRDEEGCTWRPLQRKQRAKAAPFLDWQQIPFIHDNGAQWILLRIQQTRTGVYTVIQFS